jgi:iron complex transport system substrate-binding protein
MVRPLSILLALLTLLAACGAPAAVAPTNPPAHSAVPPAPTVAPSAVPTALAVAAPADPNALQVIATTSEHRLVRDIQGEKQVPLNPTCIVAAGSGYLDHLLALGVKPCGAAHGPGGSGFPSYLAEQLQDVAYVGGTLEVNLEAVAALSPDLIIAMHPAHSEGEFKTLFDPIAPTVYLNEPWANWRNTMREIGLLLGKEQAAEQAIAAFDAKIAAASATLDQTTGEEKVLFLRVLPSEIRIYGTSSPTGDLLFNRLGLSPSALVPVGENATAISMELIPQLDAEHIFLLDQTEDGMAALKASSLWQTVPAVTKGQVYPVDVKIWVQGEGLFAYTMLVEQVLAQLAD